MTKRFRATGALFASSSAAISVSLTNVEIGINRIVGKEGQLNFTAD